MDCLLVRGLRHRPLGRDEDWLARTTEAIQGRWPPPVASPGTRRAESGLGIQGRPYYFYALRAERDFGLVVFLLDETEGVDWPLDANGATPFDSGGLWFGKIHTTRSLDQTGRRELFKAQEVPLAEWRAAFETHVGTHYSATADYVRGDVGTSMQPPNSEPAIIMGSPNGPRAWTWEIRIPHELIPRKLELRAVCLSERHRRTYLDWLWGDSPLATSESRKIVKWLEDNAIVPAPTQSAVEAVTDWLVQEVA